jgi:hypothetical protein
MRMSLRDRSRRFWVGTAVAVVAVAAAGIYWFGPQHLFLDRRVDEALPMVDEAGRGTSPGETGGLSGDADDPADEPEVTGPVTLSSGAFRSLAHGTSGTASVVELQDGRRFLRIEDLDTDSGPDLRVYLSEAPADGDEGALDDAFVDLGGLKGNQGSQNYEIPDGVALDEIESVTIWCRRFSVGFGVAPLTA